MRCEGLACMMASDSTFASLMLGGAVHRPGETRCPINQPDFGGFPADAVPCRCDVARERAIARLAGAVLGSDLSEHERFVVDAILGGTVPGFDPIIYDSLRLADATIRRAKAEGRIRWCPNSQQYVARPAWQHRPAHDRRGWRWP